MYIGLHNSSFRNAVRSNDGRSRADADVAQTAQTVEGKNPILFRAIAWILARIGVKI